jgi:hypothetical protein
MMGENVEGAWGITELAGDFLSRLVLHEISAEGLILTLSRMAGLEEEAANGT